MKIREISVERFNNLAYAEPSASIYQNSCWADYKIDRDNNPLFLEYADDNGVSQALAMLLLKKESLFSGKLIAYCPAGPLINYYDEELLRSFHADLFPFLKQRNVKRLVIEPTVHAFEGKCDNKAIREVLERCGYAKSADLYSYEIDTDALKPVKGIRNVILKVKEVEADSLEFAKLFDGRKNADEIRMYQSLRPYSHIYVVMLDSFKTKRALNEANQECVDFIVRNREDYKFSEKIAEKEALMKEIRNISAIVKKYEKNGEDPVLAGACIVFYSDKSAVMYGINKERDNSLLGIDILFDRIAQEARTKGYRTLEGKEGFANAVQKEMLGVFSVNI